MKYFFLFLIQIAPLSLKLLGVFLLFSNGKTTPSDFETYTKFLYFNTGPDLLTFNGQHQMQLLGRFFGERYIYTRNQEYRILTYRFSSREFFIHSAPESKSIASAFAFIQGLYPTSVPSISSTSLYNRFSYKNIDTPPLKTFTLSNMLSNDDVPIKIATRAQNFIFGAEECSFGGVRIEDFLPAQSAVFPEIVNKEEVVRALNEMRERAPFLFRDSQEKLMEKVSNFLTSIDGLSNEFFKLHKSTLQTLNYLKIQQLYSKKIEQSKGKSFLSAGFVDELLNHFENLSKQKNAFPKVIAFSGSQRNIANFLSILFDEKFLAKKIEAYFIEENAKFLIPEPASSLVFELHFINNQHVVRIIYNGDEENKGFIKDISFEERLDGIVFEDFAKTMKLKINSEYQFLQCENFSKETFSLKERLFPDYNLRRRFFDWN